MCLVSDGVVLYVSLSGEHMVSFVQSVEKSIMALQSGYVRGCPGSGYPQDEARRYSSKRQSSRTMIVVMYLLFDDTNGCCVVVNM